MSAKKSSTCTGIVGKMPWRHLRNWPDYTPSGLQGIKLNSFEKLCLDNRESLGHFSQGQLGKCFPGFYHQALRGCCSHGSRGSKNCLSWWQTLALSRWCWFCRHAKGKSYWVMEVSTKISKAGLKVRQCVARSGSL
jgi:hypothetical protein